MIRQLRMDVVETLFRIFFVFIIVVLFLITLIMFTDFVYGFQVITEDPFEAIIWDLMCPRLNLSDNHCLTLLEKWANYTNIHNNYTYINTSFFYVNHTVINNTIYITEEKTIVINQTKVINQTRSKDYFDFLLAEKTLELQLAKLDDRQNISLEKYYTKEEVALLLSDFKTESDINRLISMRISENTPPDFNQGEQELFGIPITYILVFIVLGGVALFMYKDKLFPKKQGPRVQYQVPLPPRNIAQPQQQNQVQTVSLEKPKEKTVQTGQIYDNLKYEKKPEDDLFGDEKSSTDY